MNREFIRTLSLCAAFSVAACSGGSLTPPVVSTDAVSEPGSGDVPFVGVNPVRRLCPAPAGTEQLQCFAMVRTDTILTPSLGADLAAPAVTCQYYPTAYCPSDLEAAYGLPSSSRGGGKTVAIVDAYGYHHAAGDVNVYRKSMGLKACFTTTKCLRIVNQSGNPSPLPPEPPPNDDWKGEQSLDLDMVSAICPNCSIILVQTANNNTSNLYAGVRTAGRLGAKYISASWGGPESGGDNSIFHQPSVVIVAAAGDNGGGGAYHGGPSQPCSYTYVVCVGGTHLVRAHNARGWDETVWNDWTYDRCGSGNSPCGATGSGCSKRIAKPGWQTDRQCRMRSEADVSATASLRAPVAVYNSEEGCRPPNCWFSFGGTSVSTPIIAATYALAENAASQGGPSGLWKHHAGHLNDVLIGSNLDAKLGVVCASPVKYICAAQAGFDGPTGLGTPKGIGAF